MQMTSLGVINRKIDLGIITTLDGAVTLHAGPASTASLNLVMRAKTILGNNAVPLGSNIFAVISPAFEAYLMQIKEFGSVDYVDKKPVDDPVGIDFDDRPTVFRWAGVTWIVHPNLTGIGTAAEKCYMFHRSA